MENSIIRRMDVTRMCSSSTSSRYVVWYQSRSAKSRRCTQARLAPTSTMPNAKARVGRCSELPNEAISRPNSRGQMSERSWPTVMSTSATIRCFLKGAKYSHALDASCFICRSSFPVGWSKNNWQRTCQKGKLTLPLFLDKVN